MVYVTVTREVEVGIDLDDIETQDLLDELESRNSSAREEVAHFDNGVLERLCDCKRYTPEKFDEMFDWYCGTILGRTV